MSRIYVLRDVLEPREVAEVLGKHFGDLAGPAPAFVVGIFSTRPSVSLPTVTQDDLRKAAELYWPDGGWEMVWRVSAAGASPASTPSTAPAATGGAAAASGAP